MRVLAEETKLHRDLVAIVFGYSVNFSADFTSPRLGVIFPIREKGYWICDCKGCYWCEHIRKKNPGQNDRCCIFVGKDDSIGNPPTCTYCVIAKDPIKYICDVPNCDHTKGVNKRDKYTTHFSNFCMWHRSRQKKLLEGKLQPVTETDKWLMARNLIVSQVPK